MSNLTGIQPPPKPADRGNQRAAKHSLYVKSPNGLRLRYRRVRRLVRRMQNVMPWLDPADDPACRAWAELEILGAYAFTDLMERGLTNKKGDPRRLLGEFRQLRQVQLSYERDLGMTPAARMALKVGDSATPCGFDFPTLRAEAERLAIENGLPVEEVVAEAERIAKEIE